MRTLNFAQPGDIPNHTAFAVGLVLPIALLAGSAPKCDNFPDRGETKCMLGICFGMEQWGAAKKMSFNDMQSYMASAKGGNQCPKGGDLLVKDWSDCGRVKGFPQCADAVAYAMETSRFGGGFKGGADAKTWNYGQMQKFMLSE